MQKKINAIFQRFLNVKNHEKSQTSDSINFAIANSYVVKNFYNFTPVLK